MLSFLDYLVLAVYTLLTLGLSLIGESLCRPHVGIPLQPLTEDKAREIRERVTSLLLPSSTI
jgi:hypothetical protein